MSFTSGVKKGRYLKQIGDKSLLSVYCHLPDLPTFLLQKKFKQAKTQTTPTKPPANGHVSSIRAMSSTSGVVTGTVLATESYVRVRWAWLSFLAIHVCLTASFLLGIIVQTAVWDVKVLKGSPTAALLAISAGDKEILEEQGILLDAPRSGEHDLKRKLQTITCRFQPGERGWTLRLGKRQQYGDFGV